MKRWDVVADIGLLLPPGLVIGLYSYIGNFNRMLGDDYCTTYMAQRLGLLRSIWYWYRSWHGRFSANAADWLLSVAGSEAFSFYTLVFLSLWLLFTLIAVRKVLHFRRYPSTSIFHACVPAVLLVFTTLGMTPDISESLFWWGGVRSYLSPLIMIVLYFALYYHFKASVVTGIQVSLWLLVSFGLAYFTGGFSETFTPVLVVLLAGLTGITWLTTRFGKPDSSTLFLASGFAGALFSLFVMVLAPGNSVRQSYFPAPPDLFTILRIAFDAYTTFLYDTFTSLYALTGFLGSLVGSVWLGMRMNLKADVDPPHGGWIFALLLAGFVLAFGCFLPGVYATSEPPPARTLIIPAFFLVVCFLAAGFVFGELLISHTKTRILIQPTLLIIACGLIVFSSYGSFQKLSAILDEHILFAQQWDLVDAEIKAAQSSGAKQITIPTLKNWAGLEYPTDNPKYWPNICYSNFYDVNVLAPPLQPE